MPICSDFGVSPIPPSKEACAKRLAKLDRVGQYNH